MMSPRVAGVSQSAVSRAFTPGASISEEARLKVVVAAQSLGYRPNMIARSLITERSGTIGIAVGYMENQFYPAILEALAAAFGVAGYRLLLFTQGPADDSDPIPGRGASLPGGCRHLGFRAVDVEICGGMLEGPHVPVVLINRRTDTEVASSVTGENRIGGRTVAAFLAAGQARAVRLHGRFGGFQHQPGA